MIQGTSAPFYEPVKRSLTAHHIRMYPMFSGVNTGNIYGIGTKLHHRNGRIQNGQKNDSYTENLDLQRSLSLVSPRGFLFRLNKNEAVQSQRHDKRRIYSKDDRREDLFTTTEVGVYEGNNVSSIIQKSILLRRNLALKSASKLKELRIEGANKFMLTTENNPAQYERLGVRFSPIGLKARKDGPNLLPLLPKHRRTHDNSLQRRTKPTSGKIYSPLSIECNQILPRQPETKVLQNCPGEKHRGSVNKNYESNVAEKGDDGIILERSRKKRTINVFLPAISTDEEF